MHAPHRLMAYNRQWPQEFEQSRSMLLWASEGWIQDIQHIGGTALPGSVAQPVIDMLAGMSEIHGLNEAAELIEGLNYTRVPSPDWCADELTAHLQKPRAGLVTHTVLLVRQGGAVWRQGVAVREQLRWNIGDRQRLETIKREHFIDGCHAHVNYAAAKHNFFNALEL